MNKKGLHKKFFLRAMLLGVTVILIIIAVRFLCAIHFRLDYYLFNFSYDTHDFSDFKENKADLLKVINEVDTFVQNTPAFFEEYDGYCSTTDNGLVFFKNALPYPEKRIVCSVNVQNWEEIRRCLEAFPNSGFGRIYINRDYPDYIFFPAPEITPRVFVYTRGERPTTLIDEYWNQYEFVRVIRLADGWYDIRPIEKKDRKHTGTVPETQGTVSVKTE